MDGRKHAQNACHSAFVVNKKPWLATKFTCVQAQEMSEVLIPFQVREFPSRAIVSNTAMTSILFGGREVNECHFSQMALSKQRMQHDIPFYSTRLSALCHLVFFLYTPPACCHSPWELAFPPGLLSL